MPTKSRYSPALSIDSRSSRRVPGVLKMEPRMLECRRVCIPESTLSWALMVSKSRMF
jgi:hypothetical protein